MAKHEIGFIYEHNRGHSIENDIIMKDGSFKRRGCMYEIFEECIYDIDLAISKARDLGYKKIILLGHSFGCNKIIYYYYQKKPDILGIVFASAPDMIGSHVMNDENYDAFIKEAKENIENDEPTKLLHKMVEDYMYFSSGTYYNWFKEGSNVDNLPVLKNPKAWEQFSKIDVPILTFSGSKESELYLHLDLLKEKATSCPNFTYKLIECSGHTYKECETETGELILDWINTKL